MASDPLVPKGKLVADRDSGEAMFLQMKPKIVKPTTRLTLSKAKVWWNGNVCLCLQFAFFAT